MSANAHSNAIESAGVRAPLGFENQGDLLGPRDVPGDDAASEPTLRRVTRADIVNDLPTNKKAMVLLVGGVVLAASLFLFTTLGGKKHPTVAVEKTAQTGTTRASKESITPVMDSVRPTTSVDTGGQLTAADISRTKATSGFEASRALPQPPVHTSGSPASLGSVPPFEATQQRWEEPKPYREASAGNNVEQTLQTPSGNMKEASLIFVKKNDAVTSSKSSNTEAYDLPKLQAPPGTRIQARLETQVSSAVNAPVVAVVDFTYSVGDRVVIPAGARVFGQLQQADRTGFVGIKFTEIQFLDGMRQKIDAIGTSLEMGPIKGAVSGKNTGKNFLVRTASGIGSIAAMVVGNNTSAAFSEEDLIRQRIAENVGNAGDTQIMNLAVTNRIVVSVPAGTPLYVIFTKVSGISSDQSGK